MATLEFSYRHVTRRLLRGPELYLNVTVRCVNTLRYKLLTFGLEVPLQWIIVWQGLPQNSAVAITYNFRPAHQCGRVPRLLRVEQ
jgi:hypothetical protein